MLSFNNIYDNLFKVVVLLLLIWHASVALNHTSGVHYLIVLKIESI